MKNIKTLDETSEYMDLNSNEHFTEISKALIRY
jgi:hypothetical protein